MYKLEECLTIVDFILVAKFLHFASEYMDEADEAPPAEFPIS
jgi:hypothetical protein